MEKRAALARVRTTARMGAQSATWPWQFPQPGGMVVPLDVCELADEFVVRAMLPGLSPEDLQVTANEKTLTLKGQFVAPDWLQNALGGTEYTITEDEPTCWMRENPVGKFARAITLPSPIDPAHARSTFDTGVLTLHLPKKSGRSIGLTAGSQAR